MRTRKAVIPPLTPLSRGIVLLSVVSMLLSLATLSIWVSSQRIVGEMKMLNSQFAYQQVHNTLNEKMRDIASQLRTIDDDTTPQADDVQMAIQQQTFTASNDTKVYRYLIQLTSTNPTLRIEQSYLRYSGLFSLPDHALTDDDENASKQILNRTTEELSVDTFDDSEQIESCIEDMTKVVVWVDGNCHIGNGKTRGSDSRPLLLIVNNGNLTLGWNATLHALVIMRQTTASPAILELKSNSQLSGAVISNQTLIKQLKGQLYFDEALLKRLQASNAMHKIVPTPGSWHDF